MSYLSVHTLGAKFSDDEMRMITAYLQRTGHSKSKFIRGAALKLIGKNRKKKENGPRYKQAKEWLTPDEFRRFVSVVDDSRDRALVWLLYGCALRISEALNLRIKDIDLERGELTIWTSKYRKNPVVMPLPARVIEELAAYLSGPDYSDGDCPLVKKKKGRGRMTIVRAYQLIEKYTQKAGIRKKLGTHSFRRSRAQHLLDSGMPIEDVSKFLRHKSIASTTPYLNLSVERLRGIMEIYDPLENGTGDRIC